MSKIGIESELAYAQRVEREAWVKFTHSDPDSLATQFDSLIAACLPVAELAHFSQGLVPTEIQRRITLGESLEGLEPPTLNTSRVDLLLLAQSDTVLAEAAKKAFALKELRRFQRLSRTQGGNFDYLAAAMNAQALERVIQVLGGSDKTVENPQSGKEFKIEKVGQIDYLKGFYIDKREG